MIDELLSLEGPLDEGYLDISSNHYGVGPVLKYGLIEHSASLYGSCGIYFLGFDELKIILSKRKGAIKEREEIQDLSFRYKQGKLILTKKGKRKDLVSVFSKEETERIKKALKLYLGNKEYFDEYFGKE